MPRQSRDGEGFELDVTFQAANPCHAAPYSDDETFIDEGLDLECQ
jgi:hypothetical protein